MPRRLLATTAALITLTALAGCADGEATRADAQLKAPIPRALQESRTEDGLLVRPFDTNGDGEADLVDLNIVLANFGTFNPVGDTNGDGFVDLTDLLTVLADFGSDCSAI